MSVIRPIGHEERLSLVDHLDELRTRLIACIAIFLVSFAVCYWQNGWLLHTINKPLQTAQKAGGKKHTQDPLEESQRFQIRSGRAFDATAGALASVDKVLTQVDRSNLSAADRITLDAATRAVRAATAANRAAAGAVPTNRGRLPVTLGVTEPFVTTFTVAGYAAILLSMPFLLWQVYAFVLPAFTPRERKVALPLMLMVPFLFLCGVAFAYFLALPRAVTFLQNFNDDSFDILIRASDYYRFSIILIALIGLLFQIPVGVLAVTRMGIISARQLSKNRGYVILGLAIVAAVATPTPDPVTMLIAMAPLVVLFELSVLLARIFERRRNRAAEEDDDDDPFADDHEWDAVDEDLPVS
jgi:sec-independent protein translocase protein TatC